MTVFAVSVVRNEQDIIETTVRHMLTQVDAVIVADNLSTDSTPDILERVRVESAGALTVMDDEDPAHYQSLKMSNLAEQARRLGASWIVPFDADELWVGRRGTVARTLAIAPDWVQVCEAALYDHVATGCDNGAPSPMQAMRWRRPAPAPLPKVAVRAAPGMVIHDGNHGVTFPEQPVPPILKHLLTVRHFPYRSAEQMIRKARTGAAALEATDLPESVGQHWRDYNRLSDDQITETFYRHFYCDDPTVPVEIYGEMEAALIKDPAPIGGV